MPEIISDGLRLVYYDRGEGDPVLLVHGFASNARVNWISTGWVDTLAADGRRVIAFDHRGHGASDKPHRVEEYGLDLMAEDARRLLDHLGIERADLIGYSMGARVSATLAAADPARARSLVIGGLGINLVAGLSNAEPIARALEAPSRDAVADPSALAFRTFAERTGGDRTALAACIRATRRPLPLESVQRIRCPVLIAVGTRDEIAGSAAELQALLPGAERLDIPGRDHMQATGDPAFKRGVLAFLRERP